MDVIRKLKHAQVDDPEFAAIRQTVIDRLEQGSGDTNPTPLIHR